MHHNRATIHAAGTATVRGANQMSGGSEHTNVATSQLCPEPITGVALDDQRAAAHPTASMSARRARDSHGARRHFRPDPMNAGKISEPLDPLIACVAVDPEKIGQRRRLVAELDGQSFDRDERQFANRLGHYTFDLDR
jgi:hypothetical protein